MKNKTNINQKCILLDDLQDLFKNKDKYFHSEGTGHIGVHDLEGGDRDEYNETFKYYKHPGLPENVFMKETYKSNSYGYSYQLNNIEFVTGKSKQILVYEPI